MRRQAQCEEEESGPSPKFNEGDNYERNGQACGCMRRAAVRLRRSQCPEQRDHVWAGGCRDGLAEIGGLECQSAGIGRKCGEQPGFSRRGGLGRRACRRLPPRDGHQPRRRHARPRRSRVRARGVGRPERCAVRHAADGPYSHSVLHGPEQCGRLRLGRRRRAARAHQKRQPHHAAPGAADGGVGAAGQRGQLRVPALGRHRVPRPVLLRRELDDDRTRVRRIRALPGRGLRPQCGLPAAGGGRTMLRARSRRWWLAAPTTPASPSSSWA